MPCTENLVKNHDQRAHILRNDLTPAILLNGHSVKLPSKLVSYTHGLVQLSDLFRDFSLYSGRQLRQKITTDERAESVSVVVSHKWASLSPSTHTGLRGHHGRRGGMIMKARKVRSETLSSGQDRLSTCMNPQQLQLSVQNQASWKSSMEGGRTQEPLPLTEELLKIFSFWKWESQFSLRLQPIQPTGGCLCSNGFPHSQQYVDNTYGILSVGYKKKKKKEDMKLGGVVKWGLVWEKLGGRMGINTIKIHCKNLLRN